MDSTSRLSTSILSGTKFKIQQSVPSGSIKRGPQTIMRTADLNDGIEIKRRFAINIPLAGKGEGSKPLFADIPIQQGPVDSHDTHFDCKSKSKRRSSSTESSSPERYRYREKKTCSQVTSRRKSPPNHNRDKHACNSKLDSTKTDKYRRREKSKTRSPSPVKKKPTQKLPYYRDEKRERDRLKRLYGNSRSRSPPPIYSRRGSPSTRRGIESLSRRRRSESMERRVSRRDHRRERSRSSSKTHSPQRHERRKHTNRDPHKEQKDDSSSLAAAIVPTTPQIIPIAVPVPTDYMGYPFPGWTPPQPPWHVNPLRPPQFVPFPSWPMTPPIRPPHQASFAPMPSSFPYSPMLPPYRPHSSRRYPPPRYNTNSYQSRPKKP